MARVEGAKMSYSKVSEVAGELKKEATNMEELLTAVKKNMRVVSSDVWKGKSAEATKAEFDQLAQKFESFYQEILEYSTFLTKTVTLYQDVDKTIARKSGEML